MILDIIMALAICATIVPSLAMLISQQINTSQIIAAHEQHLQTIFNAIQTKQYIPDIPITITQTEMFNLYTSELLNVSITWVHALP